jgi:hypothetical protein
MDRRLDLINKIVTQQSSTAMGALPVVELEDFFVGNSDDGSIGCNLLNNPGPQVFFDILRKIPDYDEVQYVLVEVNEIPDDPELWPFSDRVYILSSASLSNVRSWLKALAPDDVTEGWAYGPPTTAPRLRPDTKIYGAWWD